MKKNERLFLDIHVIQTLPPSNINRDDTGSPKTARYGGVNRARVSSQSWKKSMRSYFYVNSEQENIGVRTLEIVEYIAKKIIELDNTKKLKEAMSLADKVINKAGVKTKDSKAKALFFLGDVQAKNLAKAALEGIEDKTILQELLKKNPAIDIALFGRMVADDPSLNEDASSQVAHAISTHAIQNEFDFFTAVDDLSKEDNAGAAMIESIEFNSSTLYRYANVAIHELLRQLDNDKESTIKTLKLFVEAFSNSLPTGKVNTFANQTLPQLLVVSLRNDRPVNMVTAFEEPVKSSDGYVRKSIEKLVREFQKAEKFANKPLLNFYVVTDEAYEVSELGEEKDSMAELTKDFSQRLSAYIGE